MFTYLVSLQLLDFCLYPSSKIWIGFLDPIKNVNLGHIHKYSPIIIQHIPSIYINHTVFLLKNICSYLPP